MWSGTVTDIALRNAAFSIDLPGQTMPRRYLALWFPYLATDRLRRMGRIPASGAPGERPYALVEMQGSALRLVDFDRRAVELGLTRGMTLADARSAPAMAYFDAARRLNGETFPVTVPGQKQGLFGKIFGRRAA